MKRRIIAALAALGMSALALAGVAPAAQADPLPGAPYVALGDSMSTGNGNLPYIDDSGCLRSARSYPMQIGASRGTPPVVASCSGWTIDQVLAGVPTSGIGPGTRLVTLTVGINDLGWQAALGVCATPGMDAQCAAAVANMQAAGATVPGKLVNLLGAIRAYAPLAMIVVTGYPRLFGVVEKSCSIGNLGGAPVKLPAALTAMANLALDGAQDVAVPGEFDPSPGLNDAIAQTTWGFSQATSGNAFFVDVDPAFQTHRLCDTGDRWISGLIPGTPVRDRGLHPNAAGMTAFATTILAMMP